MILTLAANCLKPLLAPGGGERQLSLGDLPAFTRETLGLGGLTLTTDMLAGSGRTQLEKLRERADRAGCSVLLLFEPEPQPLGTPSEDAAEAAVNRLLRVIEASQLLGCSSTALRIKSDSSAESIENVVDRLRQIVEAAERYDLNVLVQPSPGLTEQPESLTDLIKRVGGFRVGTFPEFETAVAHKEPIAYLRRLTPYASAVLATTREFYPDGEAKPPPPILDTGRSAKKKAAKDEDEPKPARKGGRKPKVVEAAPAPPPKPVIEDDEELTDEEEMDIAQVLEELAAEGEAQAPLEPPEPPMVHPAFDLAALIRAVKSVGYDSSVAVNYRGADDPVAGVIRARKALERLLAEQD
ncbi:MAG: TIM barrel protein [Planctomycetota bacterium]|nr:TIM barrel protein [Planctomycetota bacterium]